MRSFPCALVLVLAPSGAAQSGATFPAAEYALLGRADETVVGDFTSDGIPDLVALHQFQNSASLSVGVGDGTLGPSTALGTVSQPVGLVAGDFDADGLLDVAVIVRNGTTKQVTCFLSDGAGGFQATTSPVTTSFDEIPFALAAGDFDLDGDDDLAAMVYTENPGPGWVAPLIADGVGGFVPSGQQIGVGALPRDVVAGDFDRDGTTDVAVSNNGSGTLSILIGDSLGSFFASSSVPTSTVPYTLVAADFDGDTNLDLAVGRSATTGAPIVPVHFGDGLGGFSSAQIVPTTTSFLVLAAGDLNGDGAIDLVGGYARPSTLVGNGTGGFVATAASFLPNTSSVAVADLDGDGDEDVLLGRQPRLNVVLGDGSGSLSGQLVTYLDSGGTWIESGDFDGDGRLDLAVDATRQVQIRRGEGIGTFTTVLGQATDVDPVAGALADLNNDGALDVATANLELNGFGPDVAGLSVLLGDGAGALGPATNVALSQSPSSIAAGDIDGDGAADLVVPLYSSNQVARYFGSGAGAIAAAPLFAVGPIPTALALADYDRDGDLDLATAHSGGQIEVRFNSGIGAYGAATSYAVGIAPRQVRAGDMDGDGELDLVTIDTFPLNPPRVSVLSGAGSGTFAPAVTGALLDTLASGALRLADVDADGRLDVLTVRSRIEVLRGLDTGGVAPAVAFFGSGEDLAAGDFDGDGFVDLAVLGTTALTIHPNGAVVPPGLAPFGTGTPGCAGTHLALANQAPSIGSPTFRLTCNNAPPNGLGLRVASLGGDVIGTPILGVVSHVDLLSPALLIAPALSDGAGLATTTLPIPFNPNLQGIDYFQQWLWLWPPAACAPSPMGFSTSRGLRLTFQ